MHFDVKKHDKKIKSKLNEKDMIIIMTLNKNKFSKKEL